MTLEPNTSTATFGRRTGIVTWHPPLDTEFPTDGERQEIMALIDDEMRTRDAVVFYLNHTTHRGKQIEWSSSLDDESDVIHIEATLSKLPPISETDPNARSASFSDHDEWYDETFRRTGRPMPDSFEECQQEFFLWKARKEEGR